MLKRAHEILKAETAVIPATKSGQQSGSPVTNLTGGESRGVEEVRKQTAKVLDTLSEAYAGKRRWEHARCVTWRVTRGSGTRAVASSGPSCFRVPSDW